MNATLDAVLAEVVGLRTDMQALASGLTIMLDVQEAHGEMLREFSAALNQEPDGPNPIAEALEKLAAKVGDHSAVIERLSLRLTGATLRGIAPAEA